MSPDDPTRSVPPDRTTVPVEPASNRTLPQVTSPDGGHLPNVGGYIIEREIGRGGMAVVYLAHQPGLNRPVAIKRIGGDGSPDDRAVIRFLAEAENVAAIRHPHVVQVHQFGRDDAGRPFLAMEYLPGGTLADKLRTVEKLPPRTAAELLAAVSDGVAAAHALGIVHRDLKPANVLLDAAGVPKVTDFGLAKRGPGAELTNTGAVMGTPAYMCPEQAGGRTKFVGPPGDVWAVGVMLYECLAGKRPFDADKSWDILVQVVNAAPAPLRTACPGVPRDLELVVHKCLAKEPADRYPSAAELAADLRAWLSGRPIAARPLLAWERGWRWAKRNRLTAGALAAVVFLLLAGTGVSVWQMLRANGEAERADARAADAEREQKRANEEARRADDRAADAEREQKRAETGEAAAKASALEARRMVGRMAVAEGVRLADAGDLPRALAWFARPRELIPEDTTQDLFCDRLAAYQRIGRMPVLVGLVHDRTIRVQDRRRYGRYEIRIVNDTQKQARPGSARVWDRHSGQPVTPLLSHADSIGDAAFSPCGRKVATTSLDNTARVWDATTGQPVTSSLPHVGVNFVAFSPDGRRLVTAGGNARVWDVSSGQAVTPMLPHSDFVTAASFGADGRRLITASFDNVVRVWGVGEELQADRVLMHADPVQTATFSPCGRYLATGSFDRTCRLWSASTGRLIGPPLRHDGPVFAVAFSPDGRRVATASGDKAARVWDATTGQLLSSPFRHPDWVVSAAFDLDGRRLLTICKNGTAWGWDTETNQLVVSIRGREATDYPAAFSRDGRRVATSDKNGAIQVWDAGSGQPIGPQLRLGGALRAATFSPDDRRLAAGGLGKTVQVWDVDTGRPVGAPLRHAGLVARLIFSADGRRLATASFDRTARVWDVGTGRPISLALQHRSVVNDVTFSSDGQRVATASEDNTARVWDSISGQPVTPPLPHGRPIRSVAFSPDGRQLVSASLDGTARLWGLPINGVIAADGVKFAHLHAGGYIDAAGGFVPLTADETKALFAELKAKYPADFTVTPAQAAAWHREQLADAEADRDWFAARFHLRVLLEKYAFADVELAARLRTTREPAPVPKPRLR